MSDVAAAMQSVIPGTGLGVKPEPTLRRASRKKPAKKKAAKKAKRAKAAPVKTAKTRRGRGALTLDLSAAVELAGSMHRTDMPVFKALSDMLSARGRPSRKRLLAALNGVFA